MNFPGKVVAFPPGGRVLRIEEFVFVKLVGTFATHLKASVQSSAAGAPFFVSSRSWILALVEIAHMSN